MTFKLDVAVSATLDTAQLTEFVRVAMEKQTGRKVTSISFTTKMCDDDGDTSRHPGHEVSGCYVEFSSDSPAQNLHYPPGVR